MTPTITAFNWVPDFARGFVRDVRPRWAFEEAGLPYQVELVDGRTIKSDDFRHRQPFGQIPTYEDGEVAIFESGAIALRIAEQSEALLPEDAQARMRAIQWVIAALNSVEPAIMQLAVVDVFEADKPWSKERRPQVIADIETRLGDLQKALGDGSWIDGGDFTVGDLMLVSVLGGLRGTGVLDAFPKLADYVVRGPRLADLSTAPGPA